MRGKRRSLVSVFIAFRIIPAHAGQTRFSTARGSAPADHPRACGANGCGVLSVRSIGGSSPRMRGKLDGVLGFLRGERIIPAHAGQTWAGRWLA